MKVHLVDLLIILCYFVGIVAFGSWLSRRKSDRSEDFFLAGREIRWPFVGASLFATNISSQQFVGQAGLAFSVGIVAGGFQLVGAFAYICLAAVFVRTYMGLRLETSPEFFERRFNAGSRRIVSFINLMIILLGNVTAALYAGATLLTHLMGWDVSVNANLLFWLAIVLIGGSAGLYTLMGGLRAVIYCDFVQALVLILSGVLALVFGVAKAGGVHVVLSFASEGGISQWSLLRPWDHPYGWLPMLTGGIVLGIQGHCTDHDYIQRALSAKDLYNAKMGAIFGGFLKVLALFVIAAPGVVAGQLFRNGLPSGDSAYVALLVDVMPVGIMGVCLAGVLAAIMSSVDSGLCASGALLTYDFLAKLPGKLNESDLLKKGRIVMVGLLVVCMCLAPFIRHFSGLFEYLLFIWGLLSPPVFVCVLFGLFWRRLNGRVAVLTLMSGFALGLASFCILKLPAFESFRDGLGPYFLVPMNHGFLITLVCVAVVLIGTLLLPSSKEELEQASAVLTSRTSASMTRSEVFRYRLFASALGLTICAIILLFSPLFFS